MEFEDKLIIQYSRIKRETYFYYREKWHKVVNWSLRNKNKTLKSKSNLEELKFYLVPSSPHESQCETSRASNWNWVSCQVMHRLSLVQTISTRFQDADLLSNRVVQRILFNIDCTDWIFALLAKPSHWDESNMSKRGQHSLAVNGKSLKMVVRDSRANLTISGRKAACVQSPFEWMFLFALNVFIEEVSSVFVFLQVLNTLLS